MASSDLSIAVFVETSLDTHLAIAVSPHCNVASLKSLFEAQHLLAFPALGPVLTEAFTVSYKGLDFHLSNSLPLSAILDPIHRSCSLNAFLQTNKKRNRNRNRTKTKKRKTPDSDLPQLSDDAYRSSHEGSKTKKNKALLPSFECETSRKNHFPIVQIATEEGVTERGAELEGSSSGNAILHKELLPPERKKLLVLDINGLLADINSEHKYRQHADFKISGKLGFKRPFCVDFLNFCFANFEVGVWSSRVWHNLKTAVDILFGAMKTKLLFCWDQSKCTRINIKVEGKPLFLKELNKLWQKVDPDLPWELGQFTPSNTLLVDDSPCKALLNPPNTAIFPYPYSFKNKEDNSLGRGGDIRSYLEEIAGAYNVPEFVKKNPFGQPAITCQHPHWKYYVAILGAM